MNAKKAKSQPVRIRGAAVVKKRALAKRLLEAASPKARLLPLSPSQVKSWHYQKVDRESPFYNIALRISLQGNLDASALERALQELVAAQEALRVRFLEGRSGPFQFITPVESFRLEQVDLRLQGAMARESALESLVERSALRPMRLAEEPLFQATLVRMSAERSELLLRTHQIVCDGISCFILLRDLQRFYRSFHEGGTVERPGFRHPLFEYIEKQLHLAGGDQFEAQLEYWRKQLSGAPEHIDLPRRRVAAGNEPLQAGFETQLLEPGRFSEIKAFCQQHGLTPFMFLLAAFNAALYGDTGQTDLVIGTLINNRSELDEETWKMIGEFTNFIVLRTRVDPSMSLLELVQNVKTTVLEAHAHSTCPFEHVMESLNADRQKRNEPPYKMDSINIDFIMHNLESAPELDFGGGLTATPAIIPTGVGRQVSLLDLSLQLQLVDDALLIECQYNRTHLEPEVVRTLLGRVREIAERMIRSPQDSISRLRAGKERS